VAEVKLGGERNGAQVSLRLGDTIVVRLPENSGGGYRWTLTSIDSDRLDMIENRYEATRAGVGSAGASVWRFAPRTVGPTRLELKKRRPWDPIDTAGDVFAVDIEVRE
jgi:predicted secreted protein